MATINWGGLSGDWTTPANWSGGSVPASTDDAVINTGAAMLGSSDVPGITVKSITLGGSSSTLAITDPGQTQTVTGAISNSGILDVDASGSGGSILSVGGTLTNTGSGSDGVFIGNAAITQATAVTIGGLNNSGGITLAGGSATATATLTLDGTGLAGGTITMNTFAALDVGAGDTLTLQGATIVGGTLTAPSGTITDNAFGATLNGVAISAGTTYAVANNTTTTLSGTIANSGEISVDSTGNGTDLSIAAAGVTLTGGGTVMLTNQANNEIVGASGAKLVNAGNTIEGSGQIASLTALDNQAGGTIDADQPVTLTISSITTFTNEGLVEATNGASMTLSNTLTQSGNGTVEASGTNSTVKLSGATIIGGALTTAIGGVVEATGGNGATLNGVTISAGSTFTISNGSDALIEGTIVNDGEIFVDSTGAGAELQANGTGATLTGGGTVVLSSGLDSVITGSGSNPHLTNANNTIEGVGQISSLIFDNQAGGTVNANVSSATLTFYEEQSGNTLTNEGTFEATNGGTLDLDFTVLTQNQNGASGTVEASGTGSVVELSGATIVGGTLTTSDGGAIEAVGGNGGELNGVTISAGSTFTVADSSGTVIEGTIVNIGEISVDSTGHGAALSTNITGATLTGGGTVVLSAGLDNAITGSGSNPQLTNADNTIEGAGEISSLIFDNQAAATVDADSGTLLFYEEQNGNALTNEGTFEATNGATLDLDFTVLTQNQGGADGTVEATGAGSIVELSGATIIGGTLTTVSGGIIESVGGNGGALNGVTISAGSTYTDSNNTNTLIEGTITNNGEIFADSTGNGAGLQVNSTGVTLMGSGTVVLNPNAVNSEIFGSGPGTTQLVNAGNTIEGAGQILDLSTFTNQSGGTVDADDQAGTLLISAVTTLTNAGVFEATNGGILHVLPAIAGSGQLLVRDGSEIDLGGATSETTSFIGTNGTLKLDTPSNYTGTIAGFAVGDTLDLGITTAASATPSADGADTTLTVALNGGGTLTYTLTGDYTADTFNVTHTSSDSLITVSAANAPPVLGGASNTIGYLQGGPAVVVDGGLTVGDAADPIASAATVQIESGFVSGDQLTFTPQSGITGSYNPTSGILSLTGTATVTAYETLLDSVAFNSTSSDPANAGADQTRTVTWIVGNGGANSTPVTSAIDVTALPVLGNAGNTVGYAAGGAAVAVDGALTVGDFSSQTLTGATVTIGDVVSGDQLNFTSQSGITGAYDAATGGLALSGPASLSAYQAALQSITYSSTAADPTNGGSDFTRTISWVANNGPAISAPVSSTVDVGAPPELSGAGNTTIYTQGEGPVIIDKTLTASDVSSETLNGATVTISNGALPGDVLALGTPDGISASFSGDVLTLSGQASIAAYTTALDSVTYTSTAADPTASGMDPNRTITWVVENGTQSSAPVASTVGVTLLPPVIVAGSTVTYTPGGAAITVDSSLTVTDISSQTLNGATATIAGGLLSGDQLAFATENGITGNYNAANGELTFTGTASLAIYQAELDSVTYSSTAADPTANGTDPTRVINWTATSGTEQSALVSSTVNVTAPPVFGDAGNAVTYTVGGAAVVVDMGLTVSDISSTTLDSATVTISGGALAGDVLTLGAPNGLTSTFSNNVLTLSGNASLAVYAAALDSITFSSTAADPTNDGADLIRTITWAATSGVETSASVTSTVRLAIAPPVLSNAGNTVGYTEGGTAAVVDSKLTVSDISSPTLTGAAVTIGGSFSGDQLGFTTSGGISGTYAGGVLTLTGTANLAVYQTVLDSVTFSSTSNNPTDFGLDPTRTIVWQVTSNNSVSAAVSSTVDVTGIDQPPALSNAGNSVTFTLGGAAQRVDSGLTITDPDSLQMGGATVVIGNVLSGDTLSATNLDGGKITAAYSAATGMLTLSGTDTIGAYQNALDSVTFATTNTSSTPRNVSWQVNDGSLNSNVVASSVQIAILPPVLSGGGNSVTYNSGGAAVIVDSGLTATDQSSAVLTKATVSIGSGFQTGDVLNATNLDGGLITESYAGGVLTLSGTATVAAYQAALDSVTFRTTATGSAASSRTISYQVDDQVPGGPNEASNIVSSTVNVPASVQVANWINAKGGNFNSAANWSPAVVPGATSEALLGTTQTGTGSSSSPSLPTYTVTVSQNDSIGSLDVADRNATLSIAANSTFTLGTRQPSSNAGTISVAENGTLNVGGGTLSNTGILESTGPGAGPPPFATIENGTIANNGQITANGVSNLLLENLTIDNGPSGNLNATQTRAEFLSGQSPLVELDNTTIVGGQINAFGLPGIPLVAFETLAGSQGNVLDGTTSELSNSSFFQLNSNSALTLKGTIFNEGEFGLQGGADLQISGSVTLSGGGSIGLNVVTPTSKVTATGANATLDNVNNTIDGAGTVGSANMTLINGGTIESLLGTLTVNTGSNPIANTGKLEAFVSKLVVDSPVTGAGNVEIMDGSAEFASTVSAGQTVTFDPVFPIDMLILDHAEGFAGTVAGMASTSRTVFDSIDLADFRFSSTRITSVTGTGRAGTTTNVTLTDSVDHLTATLHLLNQSANQFAVTPNAYSLTADGTSTLFSVDHTLGVPNTGDG